jgi:hypothetical protein
MDTPRYLAYCGYSIVVGCVVGCVWFILVLAVSGESEGSVVLVGSLDLLPLLLFDSLMVGWLPALLFGAFLHFVMFRFGWMKFWQWALVGAGMAWPLFIVGGWSAKSNFLSLFALGLGLLRNMSSQTWLAAICGAIVALILCPLATRWANPLAAAKQPA